MKDAEAFAQHSHTTSGRYVCCCAEQGRTGQHSTAQLGGVKLVMMVPAGCSWPAALPQHPPHPVYCMYASIRLCPLHCTALYDTSLHSHVLHVLHHTALYCKAGTGAYRLLASSCSTSSPASSLLTLPLSVLYCTALRCTLLDCAIMHQQYFTTKSSPAAHRLLASNRSTSSPASSLLTLPSSATACVTLMRCADWRAMSAACPESARHTEIRRQRC